MRQFKKLFILCVAVLAVMAVVSVPLAQETEKININKASIDQLTQLKGIGPKLAQRIVEYREKYGPFKLPEDITKVEGIGPKTFELIKDHFTVD
jgi:competence protein ComEA